VEKMPKILGFFFIFQKLPKVNNRPRGENSPNLGNPDQSLQRQNFNPTTKRSTFNFASPSLTTNRIEKYSIF
jgi:hypothetical protein